MTKTIKWNKEEIEELKKGHIYNDVSNEIKVSAKHLANANAIDEEKAKIIVLMLMKVSAYTVVNVSNTKIEFVIGFGSAYVINENYVVVSYVRGKKVYHFRLDFYLDDLLKYLK